MSRANLSVARSITAAAALAAAPLAGQDTPAQPATPASVVAAAPASDWRAIDPADLLVMELAPGAKGEPRRVIVQLIPPPFGQGWVENIRTLAQAHWWDGTSVYRVVDNFVAQWGDGEDDKADAKPLPEGLRVVPESEYTVRPAPPLLYSDEGVPVDEYPPINMREPYARHTGFLNGWPLGSTLIGSAMPVFDKDTGEHIYVAPERQAWPTHCYGTVGVARDLSPDTGTGAELYAVIGHAPRPLDRNIAVVGRVIEGIEHLSTLPRGTGDAGVYQTEDEHTPIVSVRLGDELPEPERPRFEYLASDSESFARYVHVRANRNDAFYKVPAGGVDVCNVPVPIRRAKDE